jgi:hypothetical protein
MVFTFSGCLWTEQTEKASFLNRFRDQAFTPDHALIEVALLERPIGDDYINQDIWKSTDEILGDLERRKALEENGLRIGQLVGAPPDEFQQLLLSKRCCINPHALIFPAGKTTPIWLGQTTPVAFFDFVQGKSRKELTFDQARFGLDVDARFDKEGKTILTFTPKVEHGEQLFPFKAAPERSAWELQLDKAARRFPELRWEVTLGANQYVFVGGRIDRERTFGVKALTVLEGDLGVQRLLVIRNCRSVSAHEAHANTVAELVAADRTPPLALQATLPATRAKTP